MSQRPEQDPTTPTGPAQPSNVARGEDDRRGQVNPADDPAPRSPAPDEEAVRKGQENLDSVTTG